MERSWAQLESAAYYGTHSLLSRISMIMYRTKISRGFSGNYDIHIDVGGQKEVDNLGRPIYECRERTDVSNLMMNRNQKEE